MEIISLVLEGQLKHQDSTGNTGVLGPGEMQVMTAGSGLTHSEFNGSDTEKCHFLQIWIHPSEKGLAPRWDQKSVDSENEFVLACGPQGSGAPLLINADALVYRAKAQAGTSLPFETQRDRRTYVHVASGQLRAGMSVLSAGDAMSTSEFGPVYLHAAEDSEVIAFDLA
jgi:redox-sensitive bicupin YhaK (pirin superfamily)